MRCAVRGFGESAVSPIIARTSDDGFQGAVAGTLRWSRRARTWPSTNKRTAEERLPCWRALSISAITFDSVTPCVCAISFRLFQNASSRLTLVLCPLKTTECLITEDFMNVFPKSARRYHLAIRCGEVIKEVPFQKNHPPLRYRRKAGGVTTPGRRAQMLPKKIAHNMNDPCGARCQDLAKALYKIKILGHEAAFGLILSGKAK